MGVASLAQCEKLVIHVLNALSTSAFTVTVDDAKQSVSAVQEAVLLADAEVCLAYLETEGHAFRAPFMGPSSDLAHGDELPSFAGRPGKVEIKINSADSVYVPGVLAPSTEQIQRWRLNLSGRYGSLAHNDAQSPIGGRYRIEDNKIYLTGHVARIWVGQFTIDRATPACQAHESHTGLVVSRAITKLYKEGYVSDYLFSYHGQLSEQGLAAIRAGATVLPPIDLWNKAA